LFAPVRFAAVVKQAGEARECGLCGMCLQVVMIDRLIFLKEKKKKKN
jgi:hypothetical protein